MCVCAASNSVSSALSDDVVALWHLIASVNRTHPIRVKCVLHRHDRRVMASTAGTCSSSLCCKWNAMPVFSAVPGFLDLVSLIPGSPGLIRICNACAAFSAHRRWRTEVKMTRQKRIPTSPVWTSTLSNTHIPLDGQT